MNSVDSAETVKSSHGTTKTLTLQASERIFVAGHRGMVGSAIVRQLRARGFTNIVTRSHADLDLTNPQAVRDFFASEKFDRVVLAAAKVGGIHANNIYPADFIYLNLMIEANVIHEAYRAGIEHLLFLGSSCIYPKFAPQPMCEEHLLTGILEPTNEPYAIAKIAGIKMCESYNRQYGTSYRSVMPTNLFGPGDNYHLENSHVVPAMIRKYHLAKLALAGDQQALRGDVRQYGEIPADIALAIGCDGDGNIVDASIKPMVVLWGSGSPRREFLHVDDMAAASIFVMELPQEKFIAPNPSFLNVGTGEDITIRETAEMIAEVVGYAGETVYDASKPDGTPRKLMNSSRLNNLGWTPRFSVRQGLENAYQSYLNGNQTV